MLLGLLLCVLHYGMVNSATTTQYEYDLSDAAASNAYPQGNKEYHCFDIEGGNRVYVFYVNWYENAAGTLIPTGGSAILTYSATFDEVAGPFWNSGSSDFPDSFGAWFSTNGAVYADDSTLAGRTSILARCLYPGASTGLARGDIAALKDTIAVTGESYLGVSTLCLMPAGPRRGVWLGAYTYIFDDDDLGGEEKGNYGTNPFAFWGRSGMGFVGNFHASTGPGPSAVGPNIYMIVADTAKTYWVGFFCNVDSDLKRTNCFTEYYEVKKDNYNANDCPRYYRMEGSLDPLYEFAAVGSTESDPKAGADVPVILAILFGCLSGVLLIVIGYLSLPDTRVQKVVASS